MIHLADTLLNYTAVNSNFETKRNYISLSHCVNTPEEIYYYYTYGFEDSLKIRLKCYKGYQMQEDLMRRLIKCFPNRITQKEIIAYDGLVKGHPDFWFDGVPCDIKSVLKDEWIPVKSKEYPFGKIPLKVYYQMQGYMAYSGTDFAYVIYESRETGLISDYTIKKNYNVKNIITDKIEKVINQIKIHSSSEEKKPNLNLKPPEFYSLSEGVNPNKKYKCKT